MALVVSAVVKMDDGDKLPASRMDGGRRRVFGETEKGQREETGKWIG